MRQLLLGLVRTELDKRDHKRIAELVATATKHWTVLNGRLEGRKYIMGDRITMVEFAFGAHVYRWFTYPDRPA